MVKGTEWSLWPDDLTGYRDMLYRTPPGFTARAAGGSDTYMAELQRTYDDAVAALGVFIRA